MRGLAALLAAALFLPGAAAAQLVTTTLVTPTTIGLPSTTIVVPTTIGIPSTTLVVPTTIVFPSTTLVLPSTTLVPTTVTTLPGNTSTTAASSSTSLPSTTSTSSSTSTSTSTTAPCMDPPPPRDCASDAGTKEDCLDCCGAEFDAQLACTENYQCEGWQSFVTTWNGLGQDYADCLESRGAATSPFAPGRCEAHDLQGGCETVAGRHPEQCARVKDCVSCCTTVLRRARRFQLREIRRTRDPACRDAARRVRKALHRRLRCGRVCRDRTCRSPLTPCLDIIPSLGQCYAKCREKCSGNRWAYGACLTACRNRDCDRLEECVANHGLEPGGGRCLPRTDPIECVQATTTTSSSTTTVSIATTTVTFSTTTITLLGPVVTTTIPLTQPFAPTTMPFFP